MKKILYFISISIISLGLLSSCNLKSSGNDSEGQEETEGKKEAYDKELCDKLLAKAKENKLSSEDIIQLADEFNNLLSYLEKKIDKIKEMPAGEKRCEKVIELEDTPEGQAIDKIYKTLNHADRQEGFTTEVGAKLKSLNVPERQKAMNNTLRDIIKDCQ